MGPPPPPPPGLPPAPTLRLINLPPPPPIEELFTTNDIIKKQFTDCGETNNFHRLTRAGDIQGLRKLAESNPELVNSRGSLSVNLDSSSETLLKITWAVLRCGYVHQFVALGLKRHLNVY